MFSDNKVSSIMNEARVHLENGLDTWHTEYGYKELVEFKKNIEVVLREVNERMQEKK